MTTAYKLLLTLGGDSNVTMIDGTTPLHMAVENGHVFCAEFLLNASADVNASLKKSRITPIYIAILKGHTECINLLLLHSQANLDDSLGSDGATLLNIACMNGDIKVVKYLLNANAKVNLFVDDNAWKTPLYTAIYNGNDDCVEALIKAGADFRAVDNNTGQTYLNLATANGFNNIVQYLIIEDLSLQKLHINTPPDDSISSPNIFSYKHASKLKYKEDYIQQKIKKLSRDNRSYWVRKYSDTENLKKDTTGLEVTSSMYKYKPNVIDEVSASHSDFYFLSYFSKGNNVNYNGEANRNNLDISCGNLSHWWVNEKKPNFDDISSLEKIINNDKVYDDTILDQDFTFKGCPAVTFYFESHQFTEALHKIAITLKEGDEQRYMFESINHAMGIAIKKRNGNIITLYYNPNDTLRYKRIIVSSEDNLKTLNLNDFISTSDQELCIPDDYNACCFLSIDTKIYQSYCQVECLARQSEALIYLLNEHGHYGHAKAFPCLNGMPEKIKESLLAGKDSYGTPALYIALQNGRNEATETYIEDIFKSTLNIEIKEQFLAGKDAGGTPALFITLQLGHHKTTKVYVKAILSSNLEQYRKEILLSGKDADGTPALYMALKNENHKATKVYVKAISSSYLPEDAIERLLAGEGSDGTSALSIARQMGLTKTVKTYVDTISNSHLKMKVKKRLQPFP